MNPIEQYIHDRDEQVRANLEDRDLRMTTERFIPSLVKSNFVKNFTWAGIPILQYPTDLMVMQELIWKIQPDRIIEIGIAFGGMTAFYADMMSIIGGQGAGSQVISIDIDIRPHAWRIIRERDVVVIQGSSTDKNTFDKVVRELEEDNIMDGDILISLDSSHSHDHVLQELRMYSPLVSVGSYIVTFDTAIEFYHHLDKNQTRPWSKGDSPYTAVQQFLKENDDFIIDKEVEQRALITSAPSGWLRRIK